MDIIINSPIENAPKSSVAIPSQNDFMLNVLVQLGQDPICTPIASLLSQYYKLPGEWLIASPIHWQATHNDAIIVAFGDALNLSETTAQAWFTAVSQFLEADNFQLFYHNPTYWLIQAENRPRLHSNNLNAIQYQSMIPALMKLGEAVYWQRILTELQMFLFTHPLNHSRAGQDAIKPTHPINGIWFWGGGKINPDLISTRPIISNSIIINNF